MKEDKYNMGDKHKRELKRTADEITKLKLDCSRAKADVNEKFNDNKKLERRVAVLGKETLT